MSALSYRVLDNAESLRYPYVATEVLCSEIWSIVETCVNHSAHLLAPWWDYILDISPEDMRAKAALASHFAKINAVFLSKKPDEVGHQYNSMNSALKNSSCRC